mgnify:CR=1 FL=1
MLGKSLFGNLAPIRSVIWRENHNGKFLQHLFAKFVAKTLIVIWKSNFLDIDDTCSKQ